MLNRSEIEQDLGTNRSIDVNLDSNNGGRFERACTVMTSTTTKRAVRVGLIGALLAFQLILFRDHVSRGIASVTSDADPNATVNALQETIRDLRAQLRVLERKERQKTNAKEAVASLVRPVVRPAVKPNDTSCGDLTAGYQVIFQRQKTNAKEAVASLVRPVVRPAVKPNDTSCGDLTAGYQMAMGLGNMMFVYASVYGLAAMNRKRPVLISPKKFPPVDHFHLTMTMVEKEPHDRSHYKTVGDKGCCKFASHLAEMECGRDYRVGGYLQSYKYFIDVAEDLRRQFRFTPAVRAKCDAVIKEITKEGTEATKQNSCILIGGHFRRGDFANPGKMAFGHSPARPEYLKAGVEYFRKRFIEKRPCIRFLILGNDYRWNVDNAPQAPDVKVLRMNTPAEDMCILASCHHNIVSAGTFGWWGAFLANGEATVQKEFSLPGTPHYKEYVTADYWLPHWVPL